MKERDVILVPLPQADGQRKPRPAILLRRIPPFGDWLACGVSRQLQHHVPELDELISPHHDDFKTSGLRSESLIRLGFLAEYAPREMLGVLGEISAERHARLLDRLSAFLRPRPMNIRRTLGVIPARYASTRFPGKPLALIAGKPLIQRVVEQCRKAKSLSEVIVATDDARIADVAKRFCRVELTRADHPSGSDRIAEVAARCECDAVVNIQGDEPLMDPAVIDAVAAALKDSDMSTAATPIKHPADHDNPNVVKVVVNAAGRALYFSRRAIPYLREGSAHASRAVESAPLSTPSVGEASTGPGGARGLPGPSASEPLAAFPFLKHLGIYGYRRETLLRLVQFPVSPLENAEKLEQLRALENGIAIAVVKVEYDSVGVDVPEDVERVEKMLRAS